MKIFFEIYIVEILLMLSEILYASGTHLHARITLISLLLRKNENLHSRCYQVFLAQRYAFFLQI